MLRPEQKVTRSLIYGPFSEDLPVVTSRTTQPYENDKSQASLYSAARIFFLVVYAHAAAVAHLPILLGNGAGSSVGSVVTKAQHRIPVSFRDFLLEWMRME